MENISRISAPTSRAKAASYPDILVISRSFQPQEGGIEEYVYNRCLQDPERVIVLTASCTGDRLFDKSQRFPIYRWPISRLWCGSFLGRGVQTLFNMVWSFVLAIKLYFRYHYRYIEWGHGYHFLCLLLLSYLLPVRCFIYLHGQDVLGLSRHPILRPLFELTLNRVQGIVCSSSCTQDFLTTHFHFHTPTHAIKPAVRGEKFGVTTLDSVEDLRAHLRSGYKIPETAVVILSVGQLTKRKGFDRVIENLTLLLTCGIDVYYILCGRGSYESELKSLAHRLRVQRRVHFAGYVSDRELTSYYAACDIFAMLSLCDNNKLSSFGGGSMACLEAAYFGKPAIASRLGSVSDIVYHENNGILVDPNSGYEVFQGFKRLCQDRNLREAMGRKGKQLAGRKTLHRSLYIR
ncbi:glycosyl transferase family 1 [Scytonema hofmannii PCC 7110]|uniref:Glycosyl transferase family 1 n=1 Tax=Scytonema hofmannii PCC 7110 TaxID=128403 RepID=A0A139XCK3_9CYAN|nr:glycosyltransferase family 4 protein [Scytonema hofmannii]KYC42431.1 glycosyl transferase family 1 [Scytonema hofmannii PCC 7110]